MSSFFSAPYTLGWDNQPFSSPVLGLDTETFLIESDNKVPEAVLVSVSDGIKSIIFRPKEIDSFLSAHPQTIFVCHNAAFDFWVLEKHTPLVWDLIKGGRLRDTMYLDMLLRLAIGSGGISFDDPLFPRNLGLLSKVYGKDLGLLDLVDKESPYRLRFSEISNVSDWSTVDPGFFEYAALDSLVTKRLHDILYPEACRLASRYGFPSRVIDKYGPLTHDLQVKSAIALSAIGRNGIGVDLVKAESLRSEIKLSIRDDVLWMCNNHPDIFQYDRNGNLKYSGKSGLPSVSTKKLREVFTAICKTNNILPPLSDGKTEGLVSLSLSDWEPFADLDPLIFKYLHCNSVAKLLAFFHIFTGDRIFPSYRVLLRTGRTSCANPNIQQMPSDKNFRSIFIPRQGKIFAVIDYSFIELRTLAVLCEQRFGRSVLAETIRNKIDPHVYTAAMIRGVSVEDFLLKKNTDPDQYKKDRQAAKACNFGIPGGLGATALSSYAKASYGVSMDIEQAKTFRNTLIYKIYPEIGKYLQDTVLDDLASNFRVSRAMVDGPLRKLHDSPKVAAIILSNVVKHSSSTECSYGPRVWNTVWSVLLDLVRISGDGSLCFRDNIDRRVGGLELHQQIFASTALTPTGRVRGFCTYTQSRNTPFQSLAADGAKSALWRLILEKFCVVAFVHDEVVLEVSSEAEGLLAKHIMEEEMFSVVEQRLPIECSMVISDHWEK